MSERLQVQSSSTGKAGSRASLCILAIALSVAAILYQRSIGLAEDDAYITFRYAENARAGRGLVYNESQRVCGVSSPLYLLTLTAAAAIFRGTPVDVIALRLNLLPFLSMGLIVFAWARRMTCDDRPLTKSVEGDRAAVRTEGRGSLAAALIASALLLDARMITHATDGMESTWYLVWLLATMCVLHDGRAMLVGLFGGLATLTRPEGVILLPIVIVALRKTPKRLVAALAMFTIVMLPWIAYATWYYGTPIPHSIIAKARPVYPIPMGFAAGKMVEELGAVWLAAVVVCGLAMWRSDSAARRTFAYFGLQFAFYALSNPFMFSWYYPPLRVMGVMLLAVGVVRVIRNGDSHLNFNAAREGQPQAGRLCHGAGQPQPRPLCHGSPIAVAVLVLLLGAYVAVPYLIRPLSQRVASPERQRVIAYREAALALKSLAKPDERVAAPEVGALGYYYGGFLLDGCGLVSPEAIPYLPVPLEQRLSADIGAMPVGLVEKLRPEWVVTIPCFIRHGLFSADWFVKEYAVSRGIPLPTELWGEKAVIIFRRKS